MDIHVITLWWLGYPWYIYVINCINIPEGSCCESNDLASWMDSIWHALCLCTTRTPIQGILMFVTSNSFYRKPHTFSGCRWARIHSTSLGLSCQGTPVRLACSRQFTQLAWLAGTGAQGGASNVHTPAIHSVSRPWAFDPLSCATADTLNGFRSSRSRRTAPVPPCRKPTDQEKSKYERYMQRITMVYPWDTHRQTEGHLLLTIHYLVRGVSNTSLTGHVENSNSATTWKSTLARRSLCSLWTRLVGSVPPHVPEACKDINV